LENIIQKVIPTISFLCAVVFSWVNSAILLYLKRFLELLSLSLSL